MSSTQLSDKCTTFDSGIDINGKSFNQPSETSVGRAPFGDLALPDSPLRHVEYQEKLEQCQKPQGEWP